MQFCEATGLIGTIVETALSIIAIGGWFGVIAIVLIENVLPFIPSEVILPAVGFAAVGGAFGIKGAFAVAVAVIIVTFASVLGAIILFSISRKIGIKNVAKLPFVDEAGLQKAERAFEKHGSFAVFICRIIPVVRVLVTIPAGLSEMSKRRFILFTTLGSLIWNTILVSIGGAIGTAWCAIEPPFSKYSKLCLVIAFILIVIAFFIKKKLHQSPADKK